VPVEKLWVLFYQVAILSEIIKVIFILAEILDKWLVHLIVNFELDLGASELWKLDGFFEEANSALFESNTTNALVNDVLDFNFLSTHDSW